MSIKYPIYMTALLKNYPSISSGRKNIKEHHKRILKTRKLIKKFTLENISERKS
tara:strand:- start:93 stop:254 length:162 start_codon:yes stop_codon:yes gene_type:complete